MIVDIGGKLNRVQVKTTTSKSPYGKWKVNLKICGGSSKTSRVMKYNNQVMYDLLFVVCGDGTKYLIPKSEISNNTAINISGKYLDYKI